MRSLWLFPVLASFCAGTENYNKQLQTGLQKVAASFEHRWLLYYKLRQNMAQLHDYHGQTQNVLKTQASQYPKGVNLTLPSPNSNPSLSQ